jgi:hypothetical protein
MNLSCPKAYLLNNISGSSTKDYATSNADQLKEKYIPVSRAKLEKKVAEGNHSKFFQHINSDILD